MYNFIFNFSNTNLVTLISIVKLCTTSSKPVYSGHENHELK